MSCTCATGRKALVARLALADLAERSLDLQYFIWDADVSGHLLADRIIRAADRGVRVRVLLDDLSIVDRDTAIAQLSAHPNIEIRAFNPFRTRGNRWTDFLTDPSRVNRRSHNKLMIADNAIAIVGGRNIADHYFGVHGESNYRDLDTVAVGPVVRDASAVFDDFWNSAFAVPYAAFVDTPPTRAECRRRDRGDAREDGERAAPVPHRRRGGRPHGRDAGRPRLAHLGAGAGPLRPPREGRGQAEPQRSSARWTRWSPMPRRRS